MTTTLVAGSVVSVALVLHRNGQAAVSSDFQDDPDGGSGGGTMLLGKDDRAATALHLYTKGHVPPVAPLPPLKRDWQPIKPGRG